MSDNKNAPKVNVEKLKQALIAALLVGGYEAEKVSKYLAEDVEDLAQITNTTQEVLNHTLHDDADFATFMIWHWLSHHIDKMELVLLSMQLQEQIASVVEVSAGENIVAGTILICRGCGQIQAYDQNTSVQPCPACNHEEFDMTSDALGI